MTATPRVPTRHHQPVPKGHCRWCREPIDKAVHPRARTWHPGCADEWASQQPGMMRARVWHRDNGQCQECGARLHDQWQRMRGQAYWRGLRAMRHRGIPSPRWGGTITAIRYGYPFGLAPKQPEWDMDHLVPLWAGGGNAVDNCRVLCRPCHRAKTAREAGDRARARRGGAV